jgi:hypothetical protein
MKRQKSIAVPLLSLLFVLLIVGLAGADWQGEARLGSPPVMPQEQQVGQTAVSGLDPWG